MSNPEPEIEPDSAKAAGAAVVGTGRSDHPNQINNVLVFPGIFKGALRARAKRITEDMKVAAAYALAGIVPDDELSANYVIPSAFHPGVADAVAGAVEQAWREGSE
jgi:malate dehydrogenase (oxaloacetate-decarboxylating)